MGFRRVQLLNVLKQQMQKTKIAVILQSTVSLHQNETGNAEKQSIVPRAGIS